MNLVLLKPLRVDQMRVANHRKLRIAGEEVDDLAVDESVGAVDDPEWPIIFRGQFPFSAVLAAR